MNKKLIAALLAVLMITGISGCGTSGDSSSEAEETSTAESSVAEESSVEESSAEEESEEEAESVADSAGESEFTVELLSTSLSTDYQNATVLVVEYNFTNNSDEAASFIWSCEDQAFQNGIECDNTVIGCDEIDSQQQMNEIQPGTTYALKVGYLLQDATSPVDIKVSSLFDWDEEILLEQTVTLQ